MQGLPFLLEGLNMKWKNVLQIGLLLILGAAVFYFVYPKWYFYPNKPIKANRITGQIYQYNNGRWRLIGRKGRWRLIRGKLKSLSNKPQKTLNLKDDLGILESNTAVKNE